MKVGHRYINKRAQYMDANHRDICKFDSVDDPNYVRLRNALAGAVRNLLRDGKSDRHDLHLKNQQS